MKSNHLRHRTPINFLPKTKFELHSLFNTAGKQEDHQTPPRGLDENEATQTFQSEEQGQHLQARNATERLYPRRPSTQQNQQQLKKKVGTSYEQNLLR